MAMGNARWAEVAMAAAVVAVAMVGAGVAGADCSTALTGLSGCGPYLTNPASTPDPKTCCQPLQDVLSMPSSLECLCAQAAGNSGSAVYKNALLLPSACKLDINVSASNCSSTNSTTPAAPKTTTPGSGGFMSASPYAPLIMAMVFLCAAASFLL